MQAVSVLLLLLMVLLVVVLVLVCWWYRCYWWCSSGGGCARDSGGEVLLGSGRSLCIISNFVLLLTPSRRHYRCIILNMTHDMLRLTRTWLISPRFCKMLFHWPLRDSFSQGGLYCNRSQSKAQMTDTMGEMRWTRLQIPSASLSLLLS